MHPLRFSSLFLVSLLLVLTACDSGGGMDSEPEPDPEPGNVEATVEGSVTDAESGDPISGADVSVLRVDEDEQLGQTITSDEGSYELSFTVPEDDTPDQLAIEVGAEGFMARTDTVSFNQSLTQDVALDVVTTEGTATGTVTNEESGEGIEGAVVTGASPDGSVLFEDTTGTNGEYRQAFEVAEEPEEVTITAEAEDFESGQQTVGFSEEITTDFQLSPATTEATVSGTVTREDTGGSIEGATMVGTVTDTDDEFFETTTDANGQYEAAFEVKATDEPEEITIATEAESFKTSEQTVGFSEEITADFELAPKTTEASASGSVTRSETGDPIEGATVVGAAADTGDEFFETTTDADGQYSTTFEVKDPDKPGEVTIETSAEDFESASQTLAFSKELTADLELEPKEVNVTVIGTVTAEMDGSAVEGADVSAFPAGEDQSLAETASGSGGSYELSFTVLAPNAPEELRLEAKERRFDDRSLTVGFSESTIQDIELPSIGISTIDELQAIQTDSDFPLDGYYVQTADIDASETENWNGGSGFEPIGDEIVPFGGVIIGNGFKITDLKISRQSEDNIGLFKSIQDNGVVDNLTLENVSIEGGSSVGSVSGENEGKVFNISVTGEVSGESRIGGIVGANFDELRSSESKTSVTGAGEVGGVVGYNSENAMVSESYSTGQISANRQVGGFAGSNRGDIRSSYATGVVSGARDVGGLIGGNAGDVRSSYATGVVSGAKDVGGLIGGNVGEIHDSNAEGEVTASDSRAGGLVGQNNGEVKSSYSSGNVSGGKTLGGLVGQTGDQLSNGTVTDSHASGTVVGESQIGGLVGLVFGGSILSSYAKGNVEGKSFLGGLAGNIIGSTVEESYAEGNVQGTGDTVGGLIGASQPSASLFGPDSEISESYALGDVTSEGDGIGGLVGSSRGEVRKSRAEGQVKGGDSVGGLLGFGNGEVRRSHAEGQVKGGDNVGGLIGRGGGSVENAHAGGAVSGSDNVGGLIGSNNGTIRRSFAEGDVLGEGDRVGGVIGLNSNGELRQAYALGKVEGLESVGGLVGVNKEGATVSKSYAAGPVTGDVDVGGLIGTNGANIVTSYWDTVVTEQSDAVGRGISDDTTPLTTDEMQGESARENMEGFDFEEIWQVVTGDYPALSWEDI